MGPNEFMMQILSPDVGVIEPYKLPPNLERKSNEAKLRGVIFVLSSLEKDEVTTSMGKILLCGKGADEYYDLISTFIRFLSGFSNDSTLVTPLVSAMDRFCNNVSEREYCTLVREIVLRGYAVGDLLPWIAILNLLIIEWYQRGIQSCGWNETRVSFFDGVDVTLLELLVILLGSCYLTAKSANNKIEIMRLVRDKDVNAVKSTLAIVNNRDEKFVKNFVNDLVTLLKQIKLKNLFYATMYSSIANMFSPFPQQNICMHFMTIDRENFTEANYVDLAARTITENAGSDIMKYRHLFVRESGVSLRFIKPFDNIEEVTLREVHKEDFHYLYVRYSMPMQKRDLILNIEDLESSYVAFLYEIDFTITLVLLCWLGLKDKMIDGLQNLKNEPRGDAIIQNCRDFIEHLSKAVQDDNIVYEEPVWWNYEQNTLGASSKKKVEASKIVRVATYSRRLPEGQHASQDAQALAKKYCMILEPGYTLVDSFERKQRIKL